MGCRSQHRNWFPAAVSFTCLLSSTVIAWHLVDSCIGDEERKGREHQANVR